MGSPALCKGCFWLVMIGALNWGLVGIGDFVGQNLNVVNLVLGSWPMLESVVYVLIGLAAACKLAKSGKCSV